MASKASGTLSRDPSGGLAITTRDRVYIYPVEVVVPYLDVGLMSREAVKIEVLFSAGDIPIAFTSARGRYAITYP